MLHEELHIPPIDFLDRWLHRVAGKPVARALRDDAFDRHAFGESDIAQMLGVVKREHAIRIAVRKKDRGAALAHVFDGAELLREVVSFGKIIAQVVNKMGEAVKAKVGKLCSASPPT